MMQDVRIGLIGCGVMGRSLVKELVNIEGAQLVGVCDVIAESAQQLSQELNVPAWSEPEEFARMDELDAVIIATPPFTHRPIAITAATAGKHIFCEKPMAPYITDCIAMIRAAEENNVKLMVGQVCRYHPLHRKVKELISSGDIGELISLFVYRIGGAFGGVWDRSWRKSRAQSGGALMEINAHELDFMRWVGGEVTEVYAVGGLYVCKDWDYPDTVFVTLTYRSGAVGVLHSSQASIIGGYGGRADGTKASLAFPSFWGEGACINMRTSDGQTHVFTAQELAQQAPGSPVWQELKEFVDAIREDRTPAITGYDGMAAVEIAEAAYLSIERGKPVKLPLAKG